jgi:4-amino-4-deoxy-L-arabinose transferase-like glycosyltransferase
MVSRMLAGRRAPSYALLALLAGAPRLGVVLHERGAILSAYAEKSDDFARTLIASGTFGLIPGVPSAYTQPLYGFFLTALYWLFGRHWLVVGLAQTLVAVGTSFLVYEIGRRVLASRRLALAAAAVTAVEPFSVWHDVHVNREILDAPLAAGLVLLTLVVCERGGLRWWAALGVVSGLAVLSNTRLVALPLLLAAYAAWRRGLDRRVLAGAAVLVAAGFLVVLPWTARNAASVGCFTITTDSIALWKANDPRTYETLAHGGWIDDVLPQLTVPQILAGARTAGGSTQVRWHGRTLPLTEEDAQRVYDRTGRVLPVDECAQMRAYEHRVLLFWQRHPGEKARLAAQATAMLWSPQVPETEGRSGAGSAVDTGRTLAEPIYLVPIFALAIVGAVAAPWALTSLALLALGYQTLVAAFFAGTTRYRAPWDFLVVILAVAGAARVVATLRGKAAVEGGERFRGSLGPERG